MSETDYDLFVIGAGSGGVRAARIAAGHGAKVGIAESGDMGGTCVNAGCVPKKLMVYASEFRRHFEDAKNFGWDVPAPSFDWSTLIANKNTEIERLNSVYRNNLTNKNVDVYDGHATFIDDHTIEIDGRRITAGKVLIATGGKPSVPNIDGREHLKTSDDMFHLTDLPERVAIIGAGYIGVEFAGIFSGLGAEVTLLHRGDKLLSAGFDEDVRDTLTAELGKQSNLTLQFGADLDKVEKQGDEYIVHTKDGRQIKADMVLAATGRSPNIEGLGLENTGVDTRTNGRIEINDDYQTSVPHIYAVGDVANHVNLTPVALTEGHILSDRLMSNLTGKTVDYDHIATAIFSHPPVGTVGMSEEQARQAGYNTDTYKSEFRPMKHTISGRDEKTMMKLVVDKDTDQVLGFHMVGESAPEIIQLAATLLKKNVTKAELDDTIGVHPTSAEEFVTMKTPEPGPSPS